MRNEGGEVLPMENTDSFDQQNYNGENISLVNARILRREILGIPSLYVLSVDESLKTPDGLIRQPGGMQR